MENTGTDLGDFCDILNRLKIKYDIIFSDTYKRLTLEDKWGEMVEYFFGIEDNKILHDEEDRAEKE